MSASPQDILARLERAEGELKAARAVLLQRYVSGDVAKMVQAAMDQIADQTDTICRLRGETDANEDLKRFVQYVDHTMNMSPGEVSRIIDFAQGQMARAEAAEASLRALIAQHAEQPSDAGARS